MLHDDINYKNKRGQLKIFLGASLGVGKTYAMLDEVNKKHAQGQDIVIGWVETHEKSDTLFLLENMEVIAPLEMESDGIYHQHLNVNAIIKRKPQGVVIDELAHDNPVGCIHNKRWQDIEEILDEGIDVYTTLNIEQLESLKDIVQEFTKAKIVTTIPDAFFDKADQVHFVDLSPEDLLIRLDANKIFIPANIYPVKQIYFKKSNLIAMRELALRVMATRVDSEIKASSHSMSFDLVSNTNYGILLVLEHFTSFDHIREVARLARSLSSPWHCVWKGNIDTHISSDAFELLEFAHSLGALTDTLCGDFNLTIKDYIKDHNLSMIVFLHNPSFCHYLKRQRLAKELPYVKFITLSFESRKLNIFSYLKHFMLKTITGFDPNFKANQDLSLEEKKNNTQNLKQNILDDYDKEQAKDNVDTHYQDKKPKENIYGFYDAKENAKVQAQLNFSQDSSKYTQAINDAYQNGSLTKKASDYFLSLHNNHTDQSNEYKSGIAEDVAEIADVIFGNKAKDTSVNKLDNQNNDDFIELDKAYKIACEQSSLDVSEEEASFVANVANVMETVREVNQEAAAYAAASFAAQTPQVEDDIDKDEIIDHGKLITQEIAEVMPQLKEPDLKLQSLFKLRGKKNKAISDASEDSKEHIDEEDFYKHFNLNELIVHEIETHNHKKRTDGWWQVLSGNVVLTLLMVPFVDIILPTNSAMIYLLFTIYAATRYGLFAAVLSAILSILCFDFALVYPLASFAIHDIQYLISFIVILVIAIIAARLVAHRQEMMDEARKRERHTRLLYDSARALSAANDVLTVYKMISHVFAHGLQIKIEFWRFNAEKNIIECEHHALEQVDEAIIHWCAKRQKAAGMGTHTLSLSSYLYIPLIGHNATFGVAVLKLKNAQQWNDPYSHRLILGLLTLASQTIDRLEAAEEAKSTLMSMEAQRLRHSLIQSLSHDLRTPLTSIMANAENLVGKLKAQDYDHALEEGQALVDASERMVRLLTNVLEMAKLQSNKIVLNKTWLPAEELIAMSRTNLKDRLKKFNLKVQIDPLCPPLYGDIVLLDRVLSNLLDNASKYCHEGAHIIIEAKRRDDKVCLAVMDDGPGVKSENVKKIFAPFSRGDKESNITGVGLGLSICKTIANVHDAELYVTTSPLGGASFVLELPYVPMPELDEDELLDDDLYDDEDRMVMEQAFHE